MSLISYLPTAPQLVIKQLREVAELIGFETRNRYEIYSPEGQLLGRAEERRQGILGAVFRQVLRHWRRFSIEITDFTGEQYLHAQHPFRFYFQKLEVSDANQQTVGALEKQFSILSKKFIIHDSLGANPIEMYSGLFKIWTFPFTKNGQQVATLSKKWGGVLRESFTDADTFLLEFKSNDLSVQERQLLLASALFIDISYFDDNQGFSLMSLLDKS